MASGGHPKRSSGDLLGNRPYPMMEIRIFIHHDSTEDLSQMIEVDIHVSHRLDTD
jgi:hypothetical protein